MNLTGPFYYKKAQLIQSSLIYTFILNLIYKEFNP